MSSETYTYKGISAGKYVEGTIDALNQDEASFKLKEQKIIITNLTRTKKKVEKEKKKKGGGFSFGKKKVTPQDGFFQAVCNNGKSWITYFKCFRHVKGPNRTSTDERNHRRC